MSMLVQMNGLVWLLLLLGPLFFLQRGMQRELQSILLLITRRMDFAIVLFSLLLLPGVLLHELSHFVFARLMGVQTGRFSIFPRPMPGGRLQLGYVETAKTDPARDALIGAAPLLVGGAFTAYAGLTRLGVLDLYQAWQKAGWAAAFQALPELVQASDFWLWFYLAFAVSSTMLPSAADRRGWLPVSLVLALLLVISLLAGAGPWLLAHLAQPLNRILQAVAIVFAISSAIHLVLLPPAFLIRRLLNLLTGLEVK
jgi:hypothetical protein